MNATITIHMYARASRVNKTGELPISVRLTINGERTEFTTKKYVDPKKWDEKAMKVKGNSEEARTINSYLDSIKLKINQTHLQLQYRSELITLESFLDLYSGKKEKARTLVPIFQNHNNKVKELIGIEYAQGTHTRYETTLAHIQKFLKWKYRKDDIDILQIDNIFINDLDFYLRTEHKCANNTVMKYIKNFKKVIRICLANGWLEKDPFINYKSKFIEIEKTFLTEDDLQAIMTKEIHNDRLDLVKDIFLFACFTGLAYIDVKQLTSHNMIKGIDGQLWISTHRQKTDTASKIPLLDTAREILEKYADHPKSNNEDVLLPILTNQKMNAYLKEIADLCGINKVLTFHCARHTFATTITLSNGVPIESVSKMLGHKSIKTTQHYAKITDRKVANDMENLKILLNKSEEKPKNKRKSI